MHLNVIDRAGQRYGRLVAVELRGSSPYRIAQWLLRCDCGNEIVGRFGEAHSCGCGRRSPPKSDAERLAATDLGAKVFGLLTVVRAMDRVPGSRGGRRWLCRCECGGERIVSGSALSGGRTTSCGCVARKRPVKRVGCRSRPAAESVPVPIGVSFGRWTVIGASAVSARWDCRCACGTERSVDAGELRRGRSKGCGCAPKRGRKHRHKRTLSSWYAMLRRCESPRTSRYENYGGRGIAVCDRWHSYDAFLADMGERPEGRTIDRIDNDRGYDCGRCEDCRARGVEANCRWATKAEQDENRRTNIHVVIGGVRKPLGALARESTMPINTIRDRIQRGWAPEDAISVPVESTGPMRVNGLTVAEAARSLGMSRFAIYCRIRDGWSRERALTTPPHAAHAEGARRMHARRRASA